MGIKAKGLKVEKELSSSFKHEVQVTATGNKPLDLMNRLYQLTNTFHCLAMKKELSPVNIYAVKKHSLDIDNQPYLQTVPGTA